MQTSRQAFITAGQVTHAMQSIRLFGQPPLAKMVEDHDALVAQFLWSVLYTERRHHPIWSNSKYDSLKLAGKVLRRLGILSMFRGLFPALTQQLGHPCWEIPLENGFIRIRHDGVWEYRHGAIRAPESLVMGRTEPMQGHKFDPKKGEWSLYLYGPQAADTPVSTQLSAQKLNDFVASHIVPDKPTAPQ